MVLYDNKMLAPQQITDFQTYILSWYEHNKRNLPWRSIRDPYAILVSEVMSQQTQISRVIPKYLAWMEKFPTVESLANASTREVLEYWSGLGYNRRALYLKKCAEELVRNSPSSRPFPKRGRRLGSSDLYWPQTEKELRQLPGIGEYTARALLCFAFDQQIAVVDTNVKKVILTHWKIEKEKWILEKNGREKAAESTPTEKEIQTLAAQLLPTGKAYEWNQALMDYAAAELRKHRIAIPKQPVFKDSDRYYRGQILKYLLEQNTGSVPQLLDLFTYIPTMNEERLRRIINSLVKDRLVLEDSKKMVLSLEE